MEGKRMMLSGGKSVPPCSTTFEHTDLSRLSFVYVPACSLSVPSLSALPFLFFHEYSQFPLLLPASRLLFLLF